jgi:hypothetical protein
VKHYLRSSINSLAKIKVAYITELTESEAVELLRTTSRGDDWVIALLTLLQETLRPQI